MIYEAHLQNDQNFAMHIIASKRNIVDCDRDSNDIGFNAQYPNFMVTMVSEERYL